MQFLNCVYSDKYTFISIKFLNYQLKEFYFNYRTKSDKNCQWDKTNNQINIIFVVLLVICKFLCE